MIWINLLPYQQTRRKAQLRRDGLGMAIFLILIGGVLAATYWHLKQVEQRLRQRRDFMETAITELNARLDELKDIRKEREELRKKLTVIKDLQEARSRPVALLQSLGQAVPEEVSLTSMTQNGALLKLKGKARSNSDVSSLMRRLEASPTYRDPTLKVITSEQGNGQQGGGQAVKSFRLTVLLVKAGKANQGSEKKGSAQESSLVDGG